MLNVLWLNVMTRSQTNLAPCVTGVVSLTQTTADDVVGANIFVNCIACGGVQTPPAEAYLAAASEQQRNSLFQMSPLGRLGRPEQYAAVALFLAAEDH